MNMKPVLALRAGDRVDLEGDRYGEQFGAEYEFAEVEEIQRETPECVCVYFTNFNAVGFPTQHFVKVDA